MSAAWPVAEGFRVEALLHEATRTSTFRARRDSDNTLLALKIPRPGELAAEARRRLRHEHSVRASLDLPDVPSVHGWVDTSWGPALATAHVAAAPLSTSIPPSGLPLRVFASASLALARAVARLHEAVVIHRDLTPATILFDPSARRVWLVDFECATRLVEEDAVSGVAGFGTLGYMAPEQTGRTAQAVDARADLYGLGAALYEMLVGRAPFTDEDPLALLHATLARTPEAPARWRAEVPAPLGDVVMKLLAKMPDERYQSAAALVDDLARCEADLRDVGHVRAFVPGGSDRNGVLRFPARLFGRDAVLATLRGAFERAREVDAATVAVSGPPGIGKTRLVGEIERLAWSTGGAFACGKCDQLQRDRPYAPVLQAMRLLVREALSWPEPAVDAWRARARQHPEFAVLGAVLPELGDLLPLDPAPDLPPAELRRRLLAAIASFLSLFCAPGRALVLFLDDVQWADPATLDFVAQALDGPSRLPLLLVLAMREGEPGVVYPASDRVARLLDAAEVERCALRPLAPGDVTALLAEALGLPPADVAPLAAVTHRQTAGNPFFLRVFLGSLRDRGALRFADGRWTWDLAAVDAAGVTENVSQLLTARLDALPALTLEALESAAALGSRLDAASLCAATALAPDALADALLPAARAGIVVPCGPDWLDLTSGDAAGSGRGLFRWPHDRVHRAAYDRVDAGRRPDLHLRLARRLRARFGEADDALFDLVHHYELAGDTLADPAERASVAAIARRAGRRARDSAAFDASVAAYRFGVRVLGDEARGPAELAWDLHRELAEVAITTADDAVAEAALDSAWAHADTPLRQVTVREIRVRRHEARFDYVAAIEEMCEALRSLGLDLPSDPGTARVGVAVAQLFWRTRNLTPADILALPECTDETVTAMHRILAECVDPAFLARPRLYPVICAAVVHLALRHGVTRYAALGFAGLAFLLVAVRDDVPRAVKIGEAAFALIDRYDARDIGSKCVSLYWGFVKARELPLREVIPKFYEAYQESVESGRRMWATMNAGVWSLMGLFHGADLDELARRMEWSTAEVVRLGSERDLLMVQLHRQVVANLRGESAEPTVIAGAYLKPDEWFAKNRAGADVINVADHDVFVLYLCALFGDSAGALAAARAVEGRLGDIAGSTHLGIFHFTAGRVKLSEARRTRSWRLAREARGHLAFLRRWERDAPVNQRHRVRLVEAELAAYRGDWDAAVTLADESARLARTADYVQDAAIALETAAGFERTRGRAGVAAYYLGEARAAWVAWGATAKVRDVDRLLGAEVDRKDSRAPASLSGREVDGATVVRVAHAISSEIHVDALVERILRAVLEGSGASAGVLALIGPDGPRAACVATTGEDGVRAEVVAGGLGLDDVSGMQPAFASLVRRCARTGERVSAADARLDPQLAAGSVLVVPVEAAASRLGVLYLENPLVTGAFGADRAELVGVIASQGAVSLQNARLFADLDRSLARQKQLTAAFERFLPRQFVEQLGKQNILDVQLGDAVERDLTVMFADLRGFTAIAEALGAAETFRFINGYLGHMERAIHAHGGFVHQYVGDGIMAFFPRSPDDAVRAGVAMLSAMRAFCDERQGLPGSEARVGIGLHTGTVLIGAIGGADRMDRGVVGDPVNLASRMEGLTRLYDAPLLVSDATASRLVEPERFALREVDRVQVKGRRGAVTVYEVLDAHDADARRARLEGAAVFAEGLRAWGRGDFAAARGSFEACVEAHPDDGAARLFVQRCRSYEATGAPAGWAGVYPLTTK